MLFLSPARLCGGLLLALVLCWSAMVQAQAVKSTSGQENVVFDTVDQVELKGTWYTGSRGPKSPCVLLLHELGGDSHQEGWADLAVELQKKGFAVLAFDFRGHGESTTVTPPIFYSDPINKSLRSAKSNKVGNKITSKDFTNAQHYLMLLNDLCAAKRFLDRKNNTSECNSREIILVGAESGATLGAIWTGLEWQRHETVRHPLTQAVISRNPEPEGKDIVGAVYLSISPTLNTAKLSLEPYFKSPVRDKVPIYFLTGEQDKNAAFAKRLHDQVLRAHNDKTMKLTGLKSIPGSNKSSGRALLGKKSLGTEGLIAAYLEKLMEERGAITWSKKDVDKPLPPRVQVESIR